MCTDVIIAFSDITYTTTARTVVVTLNVVWKYNANIFKACT